MAKIPVYSEDFSYRMQQKRQAVLNKLCRKYTLTPADLSVDAETMERTGIKLSRFLHGSELKERVDLCVRYSGTKLQEPQKKELIGVCRNLAMECGEVFHLRKLIMEKAKAAGESPWETDSLSLRMGDIYANHVVVESLAKIKSLGFDDRSAFSLAGLVIHKAALAHTHSHAQIKPLKPEGTSAKALEEWFQGILGFAEQEKQALNRHHRSARTR